MQTYQSEFSPVGEDKSRDVLYYGEYDYFYTGARHSHKDMPKEVKNLISNIRPKLSDPDTEINSCLISRYKTGKNSIAMHRDDEICINPDSHIITLSLGATRTMTFTNNDGSITRDLSLENFSVRVIVSNYHQLPFKFISYPSLFVLSLNLLLYIWDRTKMSHILALNDVNSISEPYF